MSNKKAKQARKLKKTHPATVGKSTSFSGSSTSQFYPRWQNIKGLWFITLFTPRGIIGTASEADNHLRMLTTAHNEAVKRGQPGLFDNPTYSGAYGHLEKLLGRPRELTQYENKVWNSIAEKDREAEDHLLPLLFALEVVKRVKYGHDFDTPIMEVVSTRLSSEYENPDDFGASPIRRVVK